MRRAYFTFGFLAGLLAACFLFAMLRPGGEVSGRDTRRLKAAHTLPTSHPVHAGLEHFAERVAALSGGKLQVDLYPDGQLGSEEQTLEQIQSGSLDIAKVGGATLGSFIPAARLFSLPFLFRDSVHYWTVLDGQIGKDLLGELATTGDGRPSRFRGLAYYDAGSRSFYAPRPIRETADLRGLKVRVMNDAVALETMQALGASPAPVAWGELYTALQQGVVDGAENNPPSFVASRHFDVCKHFSLSHHTRIPDVLVISETTWAGLSPQEQDWVRQAAAESGAFQRQAWKSGVKDAFAAMAADGVTVHEVEAGPFFEATGSVREHFGRGPLSDYMRRIAETTTP